MIPYIDRKKTAIDALTVTCNNCTLYTCTLYYINMFITDRSDMREFVQCTSENIGTTLDCPGTFSLMGNMALEIMDCVLDQHRGITYDLFA